MQTTVLDEIKAEVRDILDGRDPAHDFEHVMRVYRNAEILGRKEGADMDVLLAAALLHDLVVYPKGSAKRTKSADDSADLAEKMLSGRYPKEKIDRICYCIRTHSYSKKITPSTLEARLLQDADRLDALGAIGIARTFSVGGMEKRLFYNPDDPFGSSGREPDDKQWTLDHFRLKLLKLGDSMHSREARNMARKRTEFMQLFMHQLRAEIGPVGKEKTSHL